MTSDSGDFYFYPDWLRGIFINENIYAVNTDTIKAAAAQSIEEILDSIDLTP